MLQITPTPLVRPQQRRPGSSITARSLSLVTSKQERAVLGARYVVGLLNILKPTNTFASKIFEVSPSAIRGAIKALDVPDHFEAASPLDLAWECTSHQDRQEFIRDHADEILATIDDITAPAAD
jgi:hypothetical protein